MLTFQRDGPSFTGPPDVIARRYTAAVGTPLALTTWVADEGAKVNVAPPSVAGVRGAADALPPLSIRWTKFRGPADVVFDAAKPAIDRARGGEATTHATFSAPGEYVLRAESNDASGVGGGGFQCCWTTAHVAVHVKN